MDFEIDFTDITLLEGGGRFDKINEIMKNEEFSEQWMLESSVTIKTDVSVSYFTIHFYHNKEIYIMDFSSENGQQLCYSLDMSCLSSWAQEFGWKIPIADNDLVRTNEEFWKFFWETGLVDSELLDRYYGKRDLDYIED